jgi:hypothetical protein
MPVYRRKEALEVGGFDVGLQAHEDTDFHMRLSQKGKVVGPRDFYLLHLETNDRFSFRGFVHRNFAFGYWYHMLYYRHPKQVGMRAWPIPLLVLVAGFVAAAVIGSLLAAGAFVLIIIFLQALLSRRYYSAVPLFFHGAIRRLGAVLVTTFYLVVDVVASDAGKTVAFIDKLRNKPNMNCK